MSNDYGIMKTDSNMVAMKKFFGFKTNDDGTKQTLKGFSDEVKQLSEEEKQELGDLIRNQHAS